MLYFAPWKTVLILAVILIGFVFTLPNFVPESVRYDSDGRANAPWSYLPDQTVNLGLDLQGGSHLVFQVDLDEVRDDRLGNLQQDVRSLLLRRPDPILMSGQPALINSQVLVRLVNPDDMGRALERLDEINEQVTGTGGQAGTARTLNIQDSGDGQTIAIEISEAELDSIRRRTVQQSISIIRRRIDGMGTTEPVIARQGDDRVLVQVPGESDPERIIELVGTTARMTFHMVESGVELGADCRGRTPPGVEIFVTDDPTEPCLAVQRRALVSGEQLVRAGQSFDENGQPVVAFTFNQSGARAFGEATQTNIGRRFAVVLDDVIITAPVIRSAILGGSGIIQGNFTVASATDLATMIGAGALPARLTPIEQRTVGASQGQDSIERGQIAILIGFGLVIVFMWLAYGYFGVVSTAALITNIFLLLGALSGLQATLTLPGIAGIVLTIGMAVDANVLIYERIREEWQNGRTLASSIENGYNHALSAILDANITTFIAAGVLYMLGAGPVRGFAVTLGIGIITSVFTAFVLSRLLISIWLRVARPKKLAM